MFAVMGVTGQVGGAVARSLLAQGAQVRAVVRNVQSAASWAERGCEVSLASIEDPEALHKAFQGAEGAFVMLPPYFDPVPGYPEARAAIGTLYQALTSAQPKKVVCLSTIGGHVTRPNLLNQLHLLEEQLSTLSLPVAFLRAAWFMENATWDVPPARDNRAIPSFLQPLDKTFPMVATADIGQVIAELLLENWQDHRVVELEGPTRLSPNDVAAAFSQLLGRPVRMEIVPRDTWDTYFRSLGMQNPIPRMQMLDGFNEGWIEFEGGATHSRKGTTPIATVLCAVLAANP